MKTIPMKVMLIDHDPITEKLCHTFFSETFDYHLVSVSHSFREAMYNFSKCNPDLIISETRIQGASGLNTMDLFLQKAPDLKVLIASSENDFERIKQAFKVGVTGYLTKPLTDERLKTALKTIQEEGTPLSHDVSNKLVSAFRKKQYAQLSVRENEIAACLEQGATYKDIARKLFITPSTVNFHIQNIYLKLNVRSKSEALHKLKQWKMLAA
ncbi:MAG: response regulator transcription factor [Bacteroidota bacterium]